MEPSPAGQICQSLKGRSPKALLSTVAPLPEEACGAGAGEGRMLAGAGNGIQVACRVMLDHQSRSSKTERGCAGSTAAAILCA